MPLSSFLVSFITAQTMFEAAVDLTTALLVKPCVAPVKAWRASGFVYSLDPLRQRYQIFAVVPRTHAKRARRG